jgi:hypothetical protein
MNKSKNIELIVKGILYAIVVVLSVVFAVQFYGRELPQNFFGIPNYLVFEQMDKVTVGDPSIGITLSLVLIAIPVAVILFFAVWQLIDDPKRSVRALIGLVLLGVVLLIAYSTSSSTHASSIEVSAGYAKWVGASLTIIVVLGVISILSIVALEVYSLFK